MLMCGVSIRVPGTSLQTLVAVPRSVEGTVLARRCDHLTNIPVGSVACYRRSKMKRLAPGSGASQGDSMAPPCRGVGKKCPENGSFLFFPAALRS